MANFAIVGATGVVGTKMIQRLEESSLTVDNLYLFASKRSAGQMRTFRGKDIIVEELTEQSFDRHIDYALFSAGAKTSLTYAPIAEANGVIVIDNSSAWRMNADIDLVVPECNKPTLHRKIIANPNCSTIQSVVPLGILHQTFGLKRVAYTTYQAVSGSGQAGINDLINGANGQKPTNYPHPIYNNILPHIDVFDETGYTKEEVKMINETRKILSLQDNIAVTATCVRVPILNSHSVAINVTLDKPATIEQIRQLFSTTSGIVLVDDPQQNEYPMPIYATGRDEVFVGRIRKDYSLPNSFHIWCVADNIRKGAASNTVQIAEFIEQNKALYPALH
ncbi:MULTISPECIES: aspartate-semialdehyde dehydrogenase [unclassified Granulicatella]|uniref:aspartate-semialdehyde dehydrogenase n=1 Tax=unclassified Granulicatella TaxID=2630493 RepID=UPI001072F70F|nr:MULTISPECIES: aspartate-semialdehyde dehydrogenase [unclassified Granulicatella]MBF0780014.1 aspartate-semialdehyde dehydrogenase [Granulicatella sp. 19428wC4_WM01]TFU95940.1 aspartate-semialdehyde dehydrogenase [Granulicatella sp. WM01]